MLLFIQQPIDMKGTADHEGKTASTQPCGDMNVLSAQAHKQAVLDSKVMGKSIDFRSFQGKEQVC